MELYGTINVPGGTTYGIANTDRDLFIICRWPAAASGPTCAQATASGTPIVGEAAVYRVEND
jgi:hypothetical protein